MQRSQEIFLQLGDLESLAVSYMHMSETAAEGDQLEVMHYQVRYSTVDSEF